MQYGVCVDQIGAQLYLAVFFWLIETCIVFSVTVCSLMGYTQFLKLTWLNKFLSWQSGDCGCFVLNLEEYSMGNGRVKRADNVVRLGDEQCSVHFTTVALSALAMHLRYFGDSCLTEGQATRDSLVPNISVGVEFPSHFLLFPTLCLLIFSHFE